MPNNHPPEGSRDNLSPGAREIEGQALDIIDTVTPFEVKAPRRLGTRMFRLRALIAVLMLVVVGGFVSWMALRQAALDDTQGAADLTPDKVAVQAAPQPESGAGADASAMLGDCAVAPASLKLASTVTLRDRGVNDPAMFLVQWDSGVINNSGGPILVTARMASSDASGSGGWEGSYVGVAPGQAHVWPTSYVTNNAGGAAGATTWQFVDQVLAVRDSAGCGDLIMDPTTETATAAIPAEVPRLPANAQLPAR